MAWAQALPRLTRYPPEPPVAQVPRRWQDPSRRVLPAIGCLLMTPGLRPGITR